MRTLFKRDHRTYRLTVKDQDGNVFNLSGSTLVFTMKLSASDLTPAVQKTSATAGEIDIVDAPNGVADINILPADTEDLEPCPYEFDIQVTTAAGKVHTVLFGEIHLLQDATF